MSYGAEGAVVGASTTPTLAQPSVTVAKYQGWAEFTVEAGQDLSSIQSELGDLFTEAKDALEADKFLTGTGTNEPAGLMTGLTSTQRVVEATPGTFAEADLYSLEAALPVRWQSSAKMIAHKQTYNKVRGFGKGNDLWLRLGAGFGETQLIGYTAVEDSDFSLPTAANARIIVLGDFSKFIIVDRIGMSVEVVPQVMDQATGRPKGVRGLYIYGRNSSAVLVADAFRYLGTSSTA